MADYLLTDVTFSCVLIYAGGGFGFGTPSSTAATPGLSLGGAAKTSATTGSSINH